MDRAFIVLRWGLAITFMWIGVMIWQNDFKSMPRRELVLLRGLRRF